MQFTEIIRFGSANCYVLAWWKLLGLFLPGFQSKWPEASHQQRLCKVQSNTWTIFCQFKIYFCERFRWSTARIITIFYQDLVKGLISRQNNSFMSSQLKSEHLKHNKYVQSQTTHTFIINFLWIYVNRTNITINHVPWANAYKVLIIGIPNALMTIPNLMLEKRRLLTLPKRFLFCSQKAGIEPANITWCKLPTTGNTKGPGG